MQQTLLEWIRSGGSYPVLFAICLTLSLNIYFGKGEKLRPEIRKGRGRVLVTIYWFTIAWVIAHFETLWFG